MLKRTTTTKTMETQASRLHSSPSLFEDDDTTQGLEGQPAAPFQPGRQVLRVFIADDSKLVVERLSTLLMAIEGVQIIGVAQTVSAAIRAIQYLLPDLVILDFQMPDGTGIDVLKAIKQGARSPLVMMLTNFASPPYQTECRRWGANYFFDKSQEFEQVAVTCQDLLTENES